MNKPTTVSEAIKFLENNYGMYIMSTTPDYKWVNLTNDNHIGCILEKDKNGNITFELCFSLSYGIFRYLKMHIVHLGEASDLGVERLTRARRAIEEAEEMSDEI